MTDNLSYRAARYLRTHKLSYPATRYLRTHKLSYRAPRYLRSLKQRNISNSSYPAQAGYPGFWWPVFDKVWCKRKQWSPSLLDPLSSRGQRELTTDHQMPGYPAYAGYDDFEEMRAHCLSYRAARYLKTHACPIAGRAT
jgi:hypothetical protein